MIATRKEQIESIVAAASKLLTAFSTFEDRVIPVQAKLVDASSRLRAMDKALEAIKIRANGSQTQYDRSMIVEVSGQTVHLLPCRLMRYEPEIERPPNYQFALAAGIEGPADVDWLVFCHLFPIPFLRKQEQRHHFSPFFS